MKPLLNKITKFLVKKVSFENVKHVLIKIIKIYLITFLMSFSLLIIFIFLQYILINSSDLFKSLNTLKSFQEDLNKGDLINQPDLNKPLPPLPEDESDWDSDLDKPISPLSTDSNWESDFILDNSSFDFDEELKQLDEESMKSRENLLLSVIDDLEEYINHQDDYINNLESEKEEEEKNKKLFDSIEKEIIRQNKERVLDKFHININVED